MIGTIQLGATVDYAILMTTRYRRERDAGAGKREAVAIACQTSAKSIVVSALTFFAATFGVGLYSNIDMISSLCTLMARGAIVSMFSVIFILPSMFMIFDKLIMVSSFGGKRRNRKAKEIEGGAVVPQAVSESVNVPTNTRLRARLNVRPAAWPVVRLVA